MGPTVDDTFKDYVQGGRHMDCFQDGTHACFFGVIAVLVVRRMIHVRVALGMMPIDFTLDVAEMRIFVTCGIQGNMFRLALTFSPPIPNQS
jgi:hypothetical protein